MATSNMSVTVNSVEYNYGEMEYKELAELSTTLQEVIININIQKNHRRDDGTLLRIENGQPWLHKAEKAKAIFGRHRLAVDKLIQEKKAELEPVEAREKTKRIQYEQERLAEKQKRFERAFLDAAKVLLTKEQFAEICEAAEILHDLRVGSVTEV